MDKFPDMFVLVVVVIIVILSGVWECIDSDCVLIELTERVALY